MPTSTYTPNSPNIVHYAFHSTPFFIGLLAGIKIVVGGELYLGEPLAIAYFIVRLHGARLTKQERWFGILAVMWSLAQLLSDVVNHTAPLDSIKGIMAPLVFAFTTLGLIIYFRENLTRMPSFLIGAAIASGINIITLPTDFFLNVNQWKWGAGIIVLNLSIIYYSFFRKDKTKQFLVIGLLVFLSISLYNNARILGFLPLFAGIAYLALTNSRISLLSRFFRGRWSLLKALLVALPLLILLNFSVTKLFSYDTFLHLLPEDAAQKYRLQASNPYGALFGGRPELIASTKAFLDKPLLGHGSWAIDRASYISDYLSLRYMYGIDEFRLPEDYFRHDMIPAHSFLLGSLVWAGILGGVFWIYVLFILTSVFTRNLRHLPLYFYNGFFFLLWDIFFSPFAALTRWSSAMILAPLLAYIYILHRTQANPTTETSRSDSPM